MESVTRINHKTLEPLQTSELETWMLKRYKIFKAKQMKSVRALASPLLNFEYECYKPSVSHFHGNVSFCYWTGKGKVVPVL